MRGVLLIGERRATRMQLPSPTSRPVLLQRPSIGGCRAGLWLPGVCCQCAAPGRSCCSVPRSAALRSCCLRSCLSGCWCGCLRCGAAGSGRRACLGALRARGCCGGCCRFCSARAPRGCSLCCSPCWGSLCRARGGRGPLRSRRLVAPSCLRRGVGPAALLQGGPVLLCFPCRVCCRVRFRAGCGQRGTPSGRVDGRFAGQMPRRSHGAGLRQ